MTYRWIEHTAELELAIEAPSVEAVFTDALLALAELLTYDAPLDRGDLVSVDVVLPGTALALLLADWLDELVFAAETDSLIPVAVDRIEVGEEGLRARVRAVRAAPRPLVKGVTHHRLALEPADAGFKATLVLDV